MKIGLVRHFKVNKEYLDGYVRATDFSQWMEEYNYADVIKSDVDLRGIEWDKCYTSNLSRAIITAETICNEQKVGNGEIIKDPRIREIPMTFTEKFNKEIKVKREHRKWSTYSALNWAKDNGEVVDEPISETKERVQAFLEDLFKKSNGKENILIVCHGMIMTVLDDKLRKKGFNGERVVISNNGELFVFKEDY